MMTRLELHDKFFRDNYDIVPKPIRTCDSAGSLFGRERSERGMTRDAATRLTGNDNPPRISLGKRWVGGLEQPIRDYLNNTVEELQIGANNVLGVPTEPPDEEEARRDIDLAHTYAALAEDALSRSRAAKDDDSGPAGDRPPLTEDALTNRRQTLFGAARAATVDYAASLKKGREAQSVTPPAKVQSAADYAANLAAGRAAKGA